MELRMIGATILGCAGVVLFMAGPAAAQGGPCTECGPGPHWTDTCPAGMDQVANHGAVVGIDLDLDCVADTSCVLGPCAPDDFLVINRSMPAGHDIDTEIVSLCLTGGVTLIAGAGLGQGGVLDSSPGTITEQGGDPALADSSFDVMFEVELGDGIFVYNHAALTIQAVIDCVPPQAVYIHPTGCLALFDDPIGGELVANLVSAQHRVNTCGLGPVCDEHICKSVTFQTEDGDCLVEAGEEVDFETTIEVTNCGPTTWTNTRVRDCFFREIVVTDFHTESGDVDFFAAGKKTCLIWNIGDLRPGESTALVIDAETGVDGKGNQDYRNCGNHTFNNGALLLFNNPNNQSFRTGSLVVSVLTPDAEGDCDGDGLSDQAELGACTDPHAACDPASVDLRQACNPGSAVFQTICAPGAAVDPAHIDVGIGTSFVTFSAGVASVVLHNCDGRTMEIFGDTNLCSLDGGCCGDPRWNDEICFVEVIP